MQRSSHAEKDQEVEALKARLAEAEYWSKNLVKAPEVSSLKVRLAEVASTTGASCEGRVFEQESR